MITAFIIILIIVLVVVVFMQQPPFGKLPSGERLAAIQRSENYRDNAFQNIHDTPNLTEGVSYYSVMKEFFFTKRERLKPEGIMPSQKTDLLHGNPEDNFLVWFGHSSYYMQVDKKKILVDPVFSGSASPLSFTTKSFRGSDVYNTDDIPDIDYLFISHDHWDHLDYKTIKKLQPKIKKVICGLGTGAHFEYWGFDKNIIIEKDWNEKVTLDTGFTVYTAPARHFSGRTFKRNTSLWTSFILMTPTRKIYIGGDSGYDTHFADIGKQFGPFDIAILENGQYDKSWKYIHMMPEEVVQAAKDLYAKKLLPVHSSKFAISNHPWDEPLERVSAAATNEKEIQLLTPLTGEAVNLDDHVKVFTKWWREVK